MEWTYHSEGPLDPLSQGREPYKGPPPPQEEQSSYPDLLYGNDEDDFIFRWVRSACASPHIRGDILLVAGHIVTQRCHLRCHAEPLPYLSLLPGKTSGAGARRIWSSARWTMHASSGGAS